MARPRKKKVTKIKFEVSRSGIAGIGVVVFCVFLWMFLLGIWVGQSLLLPPLGQKVDRIAQSVKEVSSVPKLHNAGKEKKIYQQ